jgi:hypothetical protein
MRHRHRSTHEQVDEVNDGIVNQPTGSGGSSAPVR